MRRGTIAKSAPEKAGRAGRFEPRLRRYPDPEAIVYRERGNAYRAKGDNDRAIVAAALSSFGVQPRELPLSPPRIWALLQQGRPAKTA
jgi:hypothetical protein